MSGLTGTLSVDISGLSSGNPWQGPSIIFSDTAISEDTASSSVDAGQLMDSQCLTYSVTDFSGDGIAGLVFQGSVDGENWFNLGSSINLEGLGAGYLTVESAPARYLQAAVTPQEGVSLTITAYVSSRI
jgi:hypothetical protein